MAFAARGQNPLKDVILANGSNPRHARQSRRTNLEGLSMKQDDRNALRNLQYLSLLEATTLVVLVCVAVPLKHLAGYPVAVSVMGPVHGIAFAMYVWAVVGTASSGLWSKGDVARLVLSAVVPFAGLASAGWIARRRHAQ